MVVSTMDPFTDTKYVTVQTIGSGTFGLVLLARNIEYSNELVAIKLLRRPQQAVSEYVKGEIINHSLMRHPHIIQFKEVFLTPENICIAMEYASRGSLFQYVQRARRLPEDAARWLFQQLILAVDYSHKRGVANRDIKLENTLLHEVPGVPLPLLKICDFGLSKADDRSAADSAVGTYTYMAPEVMEQRPGQTYQAKYADIWSCGVVLFVMLVGRYPFEIPNMPTPRDVAAMLDAKRRKAYVNVIPGDVQISADCRKLLDAMLEPDPANRISMEKVMQDPFFLARLPRNALKRNEEYLGASTPPGYQSPDDIRAVLERAPVVAQAPVMAHARS